MGRMTFLTFLVLALIQVAWAAFSSGDILFNEAAQGVLKGYPGMKPFVKRDDLSGPYRTWFIKHVDRGFTISLAPEHEFLTIAEGEVIIADVEYVWYLKYVDSAAVKIESADGLSLEWNEKSGKVSLQSPTKGREQVWRVQRPDKTGNRMYL
ncbi:hypothetical protein BGZ67_009715, partial [Mortierella alpina]